MSSPDTSRDADPEHLDVVIVGAGLSGVGAAYRLQTARPGTSYAVLEARDAPGGTWDLFRYPGIRSDSDMFTLGYPFKPWREAKSIADGTSILRYIRDTATEFGIDRHIRYRTKLLAADWSSDTARWTLTVARYDESGTATQQQLTCAFLYSCTGYYDYDQPYDPVFPGQETFAGTVVHPQFWPENLDYTGKHIVVIGSGATAVTLVPAMARDATRVTMLQRSPSWIAPVPGRDRIADRIRSLLPPRPAHAVVRAKNVAVGLGFYEFCQRRPLAARRFLIRVATRVLGDEKLVRDHFTPTYNPWDQRLCAIPGADLFKAIKRGTAEVVTDRVESFVPEGIRLASGRVLRADIIVTATGLRLLPCGGIPLRVDGRDVVLADQYLWRGAMLTGIPNYAVCIGYTNASWTLRADLTSRLVCKVLEFMDRADVAAVVPRADPGVTERPLLELTSGYVQRAAHLFPRQGERRPWRMRQNYVLDSLATLRGGLGRELATTPRSAVNRSGDRLAEV